MTPISRRACPFRFQTGRGPASRRSGRGLLRNELRIQKCRHCGLAMGDPNISARPVTLLSSTGSRSRRKADLLLFVDARLAGRAARASQAAPYLVVLVELDAAQRPPHRQSSVRVAALRRSRAGARRVRASRQGPTPYALLQWRRVD